MIKYFRHIILMTVLMSCMAVKPLVITDASRGTIAYIPYTIKWVLKGSEENIVTYKVQKSRNNKNWTTIPPIIYPTHLPDSNVYRVQLPKTSLSNYYRVVVEYKKNVVVNSIPAYLSSTNIK